MTSTAPQPAKTARPDAAPQTELRAALDACRGALIGTGLMTAVLNILYLTGSFFMLEIYDRVLPSRSLPTLVGLVIIAGMLFAFQAVLDLLRGRVLVRIGAWLDESLSLRAYDVLTRLPLRIGGTRRPAAAARPRPDPRLPVGSGPGGAVRPAVDAALPRHLLRLPPADRARRHRRRAAPGVHDAPDRGADPPAGQGGRRSTARSATILAEASRRNAEVLQAMGMARRLAAVWGEANAAFRASEPARRRHHRRLRRHLQGAAHDAAVGGAGDRRLARHRARRRPPASSSPAPS